MKGRVSDISWSHSEDDVDLAADGLCFTCAWCAGLPGMSVACSYVEYCLKSLFFHQFCLKFRQIVTAPNAMKLLAITVSYISQVLCQNSNSTTGVKFHNILFILEMLQSSHKILQDMKTYKHYNKFQQCIV